MVEGNTYGKVALHPPSSFRYGSSQPNSLQGRGSQQAPWGPGILKAHVRFALRHCWQAFVALRGLLSFDLRSSSAMQLLLPSSEYTVGRLDSRTRAWEMLTRPHYISASACFLTIYIRQLRSGAPFLGQLLFRCTRLYLALTASEISSTKQKQTGHPQT